MIKVYKCEGCIFDIENHKQFICDYLKEEINKGNKVFLITSKYEELKEIFQTENINVISNICYEDKKHTIYLNQLIDKYDIVCLECEDEISDLTAVTVGSYFKINKINIIEKFDLELEGNISYNEVLSLIKAGYMLLDEKSVKYAKDNDIIIEINDFNNKRIIVSNEDSDKDILFVKDNEHEMKVVFKDMNIFNEIFYNLVKGNIKFDDLFIIKNVVYLSGNNKKIKKVIDKYL